MPASPTDSRQFDAASVNLNTTLCNLPLTPPVVLDPATSVRDALRAIDLRGAEAAVIVDGASSVPLGIVTLRDALRCIVDEDLTPHSYKVGLSPSGYIMSTSPLGYRWQA